jgi:hypothetical protein
MECAAAVTNLPNRKPPALQRGNSLDRFVNFCVLK